MLKDRDFKAEKGKGLKGLCKNLFITMKAFAEESGSEEGKTSPASASEPPISFERLIAQARKEEKEKLYPRIEKLEKENKGLSSNINQYLLKIGELQQELDMAKKDESGANKVTDLESKIEALQAENQNLKNSTPDVETIKAEIKKEYEVKIYVAEQVSANKEDILTSLVSEIQGNTKEEVDLAVTKAKEKTISIKKDLGILDAEGNPVESKPKAKEKVTNKKPPVANPPDGSAKEEYDADYIRGLDPKSEEYKEFRKKMGLK